MVGGSPAGPQDAIDVCNIALSLVGEKPIKSLEDNVKASNACRMHYGAVRRGLLRKNPWNFAVTRANIPRDAKAPAFEFSDRYKFPPDYIRFLRLGGQADLNVQQLVIMNQKTHDIETDAQGTYLLVNAQVGALVSNPATPPIPGPAQIQVVYIRDVTDTTLWEPLFLNMVCYFLALNVAYDLTKEEKVVQRIERLIAQEMPDLYSIDGQEVPPQRIQRSRSIAARKLGASSYGIASQYTILP